MKNKLKIKNKGFTLVELLIAIALFIVIVTISLGAILSVFDANKKAQSTKTVVDNLNLSIENMARTVRFGSNYYCGISNDTTEPIETLNCPPNGSGDDSLSVTFFDKDLNREVRAIYRWDSTNKSILRSYDGEEESITSADTKITNLTFYVSGSTAGDTNQPYVFVVINGYVGTKPTSQANFSIQTLMSQRKLDL